MIDCFKKNCPKWENSNETNRTTRPRQNTPDAPSHWMMDCVTAPQSHHWKNRFIKLTPSFSQFFISFFYVGYIMSNSTSAPWQLSAVSCSDADSLHILNWSEFRCQPPFIHSISQLVANKPKVITVQRKAGKLGHITSRHFFFLNESVSHRKWGRNIFFKSPFTPHALGVACKKRPSAQ